MGAGEFCPGNLATQGCCWPVALLDNDGPTSPPSTEMFRPPLIQNVFASMLRKTTPFWVPALKPLLENDPILMLRYSTRLAKFSRRATLTFAPATGLKRTIAALGDLGRARDRLAWI